MVDLLKYFPGSTGYAPAYITKGGFRVSHGVFPNNQSKRIELNFHKGCLSTRCDDTDYTRILEVIDDNKCKLSDGDKWSMATYRETGEKLVITIPGYSTLTMYTNGTKGTYVEGIPEDKLPGKIWVGDR